MTTITAEKKTWAKIVNPDAGSQVVAVIDIYTESPKPENVVQTKQRSFKTEVDPIGFKIAKDFYENCQKEITATTRRNDLEKIFQKWNPTPEREFSVVLYALAKGMKVVNVFDRGASLEWHKCHSSVVNKMARTFKKPTKDAEGWTNIGVPEQKKENVPSDEPVPTLTIASEAFTVPAETPMSMDEIIQQITKIKAQINSLDEEIQFLLAFHREHQREITRVESIENKELGQHLKKFHQQMLLELEKTLDMIQASINSEKLAQDFYCDLLKE